MTSLMLPAIVFDGVIDVSHHNGAIEWPAVAGAGIVLAFIKATQGARFVDPTFERNRSAAVQAGVLTVPYHFLDTCDPDDQAEHFLDATGLAAGEPAMIDWESTATAEDMVAFGRALVERAERDPVAYYGFAQLMQALPDLSRWPLMLPEYPRGNTPGRYAALVARPPRLPPDRPNQWGAGPRPYNFHQYTAVGRIAGIASPVDRSIWVGTSAELKTWYASGALPVANAPVEPDPPAASAAPAE
jgi:lysozyme